MINEPISTSTNQDFVRQIITLLFALSMPIATRLAFGMGTSFDEATRSDVGEPLIVPAGYAFIIWGFIYSGCLAFGIYQMLPSQREKELLTGMRLCMACAFFATSLWLIMARFNWVWMTVICMVGILISLSLAYVHLLRLERPLSTTERILVQVPLSVFIGWVTVAMFANTASALKVSGLLDRGLSEETWTILMLVSCGCIACGVVRISGGNIWYAGTILWALVGIVVANLMREPANRIPLVAGGLAVVVLLVLIKTQLFPGSGRQVLS